MFHNHFWPARRGKTKRDPNDRWESVELVRNEWGPMLTEHAGNKIASVRTGEVLTIVGYTPTTLTVKRGS